MGRIFCLTLLLSTVLSVKASANTPSDSEPSGETKKSPSENSDADTTSSPPSSSSEEGASDQGVEIQMGDPNVEIQMGDPENMVVSAPVPKPPPIDPEVLRRWWKSAGELRMGKTAYKVEEMDFNDGLCKYKLKSGVMIPVYGYRTGLREWWG